MEPLNRLQDWLLSAIVEPATAQHVNDHLLPSPTQSPADRLAVYQHAYLARLLEVLQNLFPCTRFAIGDELFNQFAAAYIQAHPPHSYTLANLSDKFADYLDATRPADWGAFLVELVRLEQAIDRIFDAPGPENLPPFTLPTTADASLKLSLVPGCELHAFHYPVSNDYTAWKSWVAVVRAANHGSNDSPAWPARQKQHVALLRRNYIVRRYELTATQFALLSGLQAGAPLGDALAIAADENSKTLETLAHDFQSWFTFWAAERFFI